MPSAALTPRDRRALVAVAVQFFVNGAMMASFIARAPQIRDQIGVDIAGFGLLLTVVGTVGIASSLLAGRIVHRFTTRRLLEVGAIVMVPSLVVIGAADSPYLWLLGMALYSFFDTFVDISMNLQGSWISARRHAPVMNRLHGLWSVGTLAGGLGAVAAGAGGASPLTHLSIVAGLMACALRVATRHLLPHDEDGHAASPERQVSERIEPRPPKATARTSSSWRIARLPISFVMLAGVFAQIVELTGSDFGTFRLSDDFETSASAASAAYVAYAGGMTAMRLAGDSLQARLGTMGLHRLAVALAFVGFSAASLAPAPAVSIAGLLLAGLGVATFMPKLYDDAARLPGLRGAGLGAMTAAIRVAHLAIPAAVGSVAEGTSVGVALASFALPAVVGLVIVSEWSARLTR